MKSSRGLSILAISHLLFGWRPKRRLPGARSAKHHSLVRGLERTSALPLVRLSVGVHVVVPLIGDWRAGLALFDDCSTAIAIPWQRMLLIGATDTPCEEAEPLPVADPGEGHAAAAPLRECPSAGTLAAWPCCPYVASAFAPSRSDASRPRAPAGATSSRSAQGEWSRSPAAS